MDTKKRPAPRNDGAARAAKRPLAFARSRVRLRVEVSYGKEGTPYAARGSGGAGTCAISTAACTSSSSAAGSARVAHQALIHGDVVCLGADANSDDTRGRHWRLAYSDLAQTQFGHTAPWLEYHPTSGVVWVLGGWHLPRRVDAPPTARRMLLSMLARHRELDAPPDGVFVTNSELTTKLWPEDADPQARGDSAVAHVAWELRAALGDDQQFLHTVRNSGYRLTPRP